MPAIVGNALTEARLTPLTRRDFGQQSTGSTATIGLSGMSPTAFAFLIPVIVIAVFCPFLCVFCLRKRRTAAIITPARPMRKPVLQREEARKRLAAVTEVSTKTASPVQEDTTAPEPTEGDRTTVAERECAICLSELDAPAPPEPARIVSEAPASNEPSSRPPSIQNVSTAPNDTILKLNACGHEFHAECLVSWCVLRKTTCPICRAVYISKEEMVHLDEEAGIAIAPIPVYIPRGLRSSISAPNPARAPAAATTPATQTTTNWRYFWRGDNVWNARNASEAQLREGGSTSRWQHFWRGRG